jgi:hypothetical protein
LGKPLPNAVPGPLSPDVIAGTLPLAAGLYIIVRGIDNFLHKDARKHVTKKLEAPTKGKEVSNGLPAESRKAVSGGSGDSSE